MSYCPIDHLFIRVLMRIRITHPPWMSSEPVQRTANARRYRVEHRGIDLRRPHLTAPEQFCPMRLRKTCFVVGALRRPAHMGQKGTSPTRCSKRSSSKAAASCHFKSGGWDDPNRARRTSTFLSCAFREQEDDQVTILILPRPRVARAQKIISLHPPLF
jgi:hypothetical protein